MQGIAGCCRERGSVVPSAEDDVEEEMDRTENLLDLSMRLGFVGEGLNEAFRDQGNRYSSPNRPGCSDYPHILGET